jgi:hypothetical protein
MRIAILARSNNRRKNGEYGCCVAGITEHGKWIRLVADKSGDSLPDDDTAPQVCSVIDAEIKPAPLQYQPENAILADFVYINDDIDDINEYVKGLEVVYEDYLFGNDRNNLSELGMRRVIGSLRLVKAEDLEIYKNDKGSWKTRFSYNGVKYEDIAMKDPKNYRKEKFAKANIVVSLPNDDGGYSGFYKFVAAIYPAD